MPEDRNAHHSGEAWASAHLSLPPGAPTSYSDALTGMRIEAKGRRLALGPLFTLLPVAVLVDEKAGMR